MSRQHLTRRERRELRIRRAESEGYRLGSEQARRREFAEDDARIAALGEQSAEHDRRCIEIIETELPAVREGLAFLRTGKTPRADAVAAVAKEGRR